MKLPHKQKCDPEVVKDGQVLPSKPTSKGEKWFDWMTYGGVNFVGTFIATIPIAYALKYGKGAKWYQKGADWLTKKGVSHGHAENILLTTATMQGGNVAVFPVKYLEDRKAKIVSWFNEKLGEPDASEDIKREADQTWPSLIKSRLVAWGITFGSFTAAGMAFGKKFEEYGDKFAKKMCDIMKKPTHLIDPKVLKTITDAKKLEKLESKAFRYGKLGAVDVYATAASATILYVASRFFAEPDKDFPCDPKDGHGNSLSVKERPVLAAPESTEPIVDAAVSRVSSVEPRTVLSRAAAPKASHADAALCSKQAESTLALSS